MVFLHQTARPSCFRDLTLSGLAAMGFLLGGTGAGVSQEAVVPNGGDSAVLRWRNDDTLTGSVLAGPEGMLRFSAKPFAAPLELSPDFLSGLRFPSVEEFAPLPEAPLFEAVLKNGDRLRGELLAIDENTFTFRCPPLSGPVTIRRESTQRLSRIGDGGGGFSGLGDLSDWTSRGRDRKPDDWFTDLRGELATYQWSGNLFRELPLPERVEVEFRARFPEGKPYLLVGLLREPQNGPMLETWDDHLVLTHRTRFSPVMKLTEETRELHFRLFWDQRTGETRLCDPSGRLLATVQGETSAENPDAARRASDPLRRGFYVLSRNPEMKLVALEVRTWDGKPAPVIDLSRPRLRLKGEAVRFGVDAITMLPDAGEMRLGGQSVPLDRLLEWVLSPGEDVAASASQPPPANTTRMAWFTGTSISGDFERINESGVVLRPAWSNGPITASFTEARELRFPEQARPVTFGSDVLETGSLSITGTVRLAPSRGDASDSLLAWQPAGANTAVPFASDLSFRVLRGQGKEARSDALVNLGQSRLYLTDNEILTGRLLSVTPEKVVFESPFTGRFEIDPAKVRAVDVGTSGRLLEGFRDPEWEEVEDAEEEVVLTPDSATMRGGSFGNPSLLLGDRIRFEAEWQESYGAMTLRLFASGRDTNLPSTDVIIAAQGNRLFIGKLNESGAFSFSGDQIPITDNRAAVEVAVLTDKVEVFINEKSAMSVPLSPEKVSGNGIYFKMGGGWQGWNQAGSTIVVSRFRIENSSGSVPRRIIDPRAKAHALAIPRNLRERPPTHLLIAPNGDLLRGVLESADESLVHFHANGNPLEIPRERVSSIVRIDPPAPLPDKEEPVKESKPGPRKPIDPFAEDHYAELEAYNFRVSHQLVLRDGARLRLEGKGVEGSRLAGISPLLGKCLIPLEQVREISRTPPVPVHRAKPLDLAIFNDWKAVFTPDPEIPESGGTSTSPLIGKDAPAFELTMLDDSTFRLADYRGKVVVLDFWATWCGPCIKAMPDVMAAVGAFPPDAVAFVAVNQGETPPLINDFLKARKWDDTPVALDFNMKVGRSYQVEGIPHTVVVGPDGKIAWVHTGYSPDLKKSLFEAIATILSGGPRP